MLVIDTPKDLLVLMAYRARFSRSRCVLLLSNHASAAWTSSWSGSCGASSVALSGALFLLVGMRTLPVLCCKLIFLPSNCPDHTRIEYPWQDLHGDVTRSHKCHTMDDPMNQARSYLRTRN